MSGEGRAEVVSEVARRKADLRQLYVEYKKHFMFDQDYWPDVAKAIVTLSNYHDGEDRRSKRDLSMYMLGHDVPEDRMYNVYAEEFKSGVIHAMNGLHEAIREYEQELSNKTEGVHKGIFAEAFILAAELGVAIARETLKFQTETIERYTHV